ncbi:MAG: hypothetical protein JWQ04_300 [Pedosphaera sp.]|nr:hypothetical protein [Pedosphaera sp.]
MSITKYLILCLLCVGCCLTSRARASEPVSAGPLYERFHLTLEPGDRTEILSPFYYSELKETQRQWAVPPLMAHTEDPVTESEEFDFLYPVLTYNRYGAESRWQFFQVFAFAGGKNQDTSGKRHFTLFPIYFQQRSTDPRQDYTAVFPFYGHLENRLFRDEIDFIMFPGYSKTRKKDVVTYNMPYPFFHLRYGDGLRGWQIWPFTGREHKDITFQTNSSGESITNGGHDRLFVNWPFYVRVTNGIGTENPVREEALIPFYTLYRSKLRDTTSWGWPLGVTHTVNREKKYTEWDAPWPLVEFAHGEGKTERRVWPLFSEAHSPTSESDWYLWPVYKYNRIVSPPLYRDRTRILFFLYSDMNLKSTETGRSLRRTELWPFFTRRRDLNGNERLQVLAILEPIFPGNKGFEREYSQVYALWRAEQNPKTHATSQSLLWNLYRRETAPEHKKISLLFGLFQYQLSPAGRQWRVCYIPVGKVKSPVHAAEPASGH